MKILQISNKVPFPLKDGGALAIHHLTKAFSDLGNNVTLLAMNTSKHKVDEKLVKSYFEKYPNVSSELIYINTDTSLKKAFSNLLFSKIPYNAERFINKEFENKLKALLKSENFDIIQLEGLYLMPYIEVIRKYSNARVALRAHNIEHEIWQRSVSDESNPFKKIYFSILTRRLRKFERNYLNYYDLLIPITQRDADKFNLMGNIKPCFVCPYAIDFEFPAGSNPDSHEKSFFYIGSLDWIPNQKGLIWFVTNVWTKIKNELHNIRFYVAGRNAPDWFKEFMLKNDVDFFGEVENANEFMEDKMIMILPLFSGSGMRVKIIEAMAAGKVIITTPVGAEGIEITNNQDAILANDADNFIEAIKNLYTDHNLYLHIAKNASNFVKVHFDSKKITSALVEFYKASLL